MITENNSFSKFIKIYQFYPKWLVYPVQFNLSTGVTKNANDLCHGEFVWILTTYNLLNG